MYGMGGEVSSAPRLGARSLSESFLCSIFHLRCSERPAFFFVRGIHSGLLVDPASALGFRAT